MADERAAVLARVTGKVQGVYFRGWTQQQAQRLGVHGWVRNEADGSVSALLAGSPQRVDEIVRLLRQGPPGAAVATVSVQPTEPAPWPVRFAILR
jgi:acylphosphatase